MAKSSKTGTFPVPGTGAALLIMGHEFHEFAVFVVREVVLYFIFLRGDAARSVSFNDDVEQH